jgi:hypothetical protein
MKISRVSGALLGLLISSFLHGLYDFFAIGGSMAINIGPPAVILLVWSWQMCVFHLHTKDLE